MDHGTAFYIVGPLLAASAVIFAFVGLRFENFPGRLAPLVALWFIVLVGASTTLAVLHSQDDEAKEAQERGLSHATEEAEKAEEQ